MFIAFLTDCLADSQTVEEIKNKAKLSPVKIDATNLFASWLPEILIL